ncbi:MAG: ABC transporter permease subunit, partial [Pontixanthobacter sp.]
MGFETDVFISALFSPAFARGAGITLSLALLSHALAILLSLPMAIVLLGKNRIAAGLIKAYIVVFRAIPLLLLLLLIWNGLPQIHPIFRDSWFSPFLGALIGIAISEAAYQVEINRSALSALPEGQTDAGKAL